jgi:hypothetical protein
LIICFYDVIIKQKIIIVIFLQNEKSHTYGSRFIPEEVAETSQIFLRDAHVLPKLLSYEEYCRYDRW